MLGFRALFASPPDVLNPLRSEQEAFRFLIYVVVIVGVIVGVVLIARGL